MLRGFLQSQKKYYQGILVAVGVILPVFATARGAEPWERVRSGVEGAKALVVVTTDDWDSVPGTLHLFLRQGEDWREVDTMPVAIGRHGMGWGRGLEDFRELSGPSKREGDGKSPAGVFRLTQSFGQDGQGSASLLPYLPINSHHVCVDDGHSRFYNRILDEQEVVKDWQSFEQMLIPAYRIGVEVGHNLDAPVAGGGSCIFLHIWRGPGMGTAGCSAMAEADLQRLVARLAAQSLLVQMPLRTYQQMASLWKLPSLAAQ